MNSPFPTHRLTTLASLVLTAFSLCACGGGGSTASSSSSTSSTQAHLHGTAATGLAVLGTVTLLDANGTQRTVNTDSMGQFSFDVSSMKAPFMLKVEGTSGSRFVRLFSLATSSNLNGVVNITSLTDVIAANVLQQDPSSAFDTRSFDRINPASIESETAILNLKIRSVIEAAGLSSASFNPISSPIAVQNSREDFILDLIKTSFNPVSGRFTLTNAVDGQSLEDDISYSAQDEILQGVPELQHNADFTATLDNVTALRSRIAALNSILAEDLDRDVKAQQLASFIHPSFLHSGSNSTSMIDFLSHGIYRLSDIELAQRKILTLEGLAVTILRVNATLRDSLNRVVRRLDDQYFVLGTDYGPDFMWLGNTRSLNFNVEFASRRKAVAPFHSEYSVCYESGIQIKITDPLDQFSSTPIYIDVDGPGLNAPVRFTQLQPYQPWISTNPAFADGFIPLTSSCTQDPVERAIQDRTIQNLPSNPQYTFRGYDFFVEPINLSSPIDHFSAHPHSIRPMTSSELEQTPYFIDIPTLDASLTELTSNGTFTTSISGTRANDGFISEFYTQLTYFFNDAPYIIDQSSSVLSQNGSFTFGIDLFYPAPPLNTPLLSQQFVATTFSPQGHLMISSWSRSSP